jgi:hypothetical protein
MNSRKIYFYIMVFLLGSMCTFAVSAEAQTCTANITATVDGTYQRTEGSNPEPTLSACESIYANTDVAAVAANAVINIPDNYNGTPPVLSGTISYNGINYSVSGSCQTYYTDDGEGDYYWAVQSCTLVATATCTFNNETILSGKSVTAYQAASVAAGSACVSQVRTCGSTGVLSGTYAYPSCVVDQKASPSASAAAVQLINSILLLNN